MHSKKEKLRARLREKFFAGHNGKPSILIFGLGLSGGGVGAARFFAELGYSVTVTDAKPKTQLVASLHALRSYPIKYVLGRHRKKDFARADLVVKNPGILKTNRYLKSAKRITNDAEIFLALAPHARTIGVTGTKGKTTTTMLIKHFLGKRAALVGVPGVSFLDYFFLSREPQWIVAEFSSFDLEYVRTSPHVAVVTSLFADHLNRYVSFSAYARAKMNIVRFQKKGDYAFLWKSLAVKWHCPRMLGTQIWVCDNKEFSVPWNISRHSAFLAYTVARSLGVKRKDLVKKIKMFRPARGRLEIVVKRKGNIFINDTTATNPGAAAFSTLTLVKKYPKAVVITGGEDKNIPLKDVLAYARVLRACKVSVVILPGSFSDKLVRILSVPYELARSMDDAVKRACGKGTVIALIPGAASFNMFANEFDRGDSFIRAARQCGVS